MKDDGLVVRLTTILSSFSLKIQKISVEPLAARYKPRSLDLLNPTKISMTCGWGP